MLGLFYPYGIVLQALAILHFVRRRPDNYWLFVILMFGGVGALIYLAVEVIPDARPAPRRVRRFSAPQADQGARGR